MKKLQVLLEVDTSDTITVMALRDDLVSRLRAIDDKTITYEKGTLPDPNTKRTGNIYYSRAMVLQKNARRRRG